MTATSNTPEQMTLCLLGRPEQVAATIRCLGFMAPTALEPRPQRAEYFDIATPATCVADPAVAVPPFPECFGNLSELAEENCLELPAQAWEPATPKRQHSRISVPAPQELTERLETLQLENSAGNAEIAAMQAALARSEAQAEETKLEIMEERHMSQQRAETFDASLRQLLSEYQTSSAELADMKATINSEAAVSASLVEAMDELNTMCRSRFNGMLSEAKVDRDMMEGLTALVEQHAVHAEPTAAAAAAAAEAVEMKAELDEQHYIASEFRESCEVRLKNLQHEIKTAQDEVALTTGSTEMCEERLKNLQSDVTTGKDETTMLKAHFGNLLAAWERDRSMRNA